MSDVVTPGIVSLRNVMATFEAIFPPFSSMNGINAARIRLDLLFGSGFFPKRFGAMGVPPS